MPPENVRYPPSRHARNYIKNNIAKCYNPPPKPSEIIEAKARRNGMRRFFLTQKELYRGFWKNDLKHGHGKLIDRTILETYEGAFHDGKRSNYGVISNMTSNGKQNLLYEGEFANGAPHGEGVIHTDTYQFTGRVINGKASGLGIAWFKDGTIYIGTWFNGKRMGQGMEVHKNQNRYEGNWYNDKKHGYGQYCFFNRGQALEGVWVADVCRRGIIRNIKYRQGANNPVRFPMPKLMLKNWTKYYQLWEEDMLASVGKYIREDLGIQELKEEDSEPCSVKETYHDMKIDGEDPLAHEIDHLHLGTYLKYPPDITHIVPCVIFRQ